MEIVRIEPEKLKAKQKYKKYIDALNSLPPMSGVSIEKSEANKIHSSIYQYFSRSNKNLRRKTMNDKVWFYFVDENGDLI